MKISELIEVLKQLPKEAELFELHFHNGVLFLREGDPFSFIGDYPEYDVDDIDLTNPADIAKLIEVLK